MKISITLEDKDGGGVDIYVDFPPGSADSRAAITAITILDMIGAVSSEKPHLSEVPVEKPETDLPKEGL